MKVLENEAWLGVGILALAGLASGCERDAATGAAERREAAAELRDESAEVNADRAEAAGADADNTRKNVRDRDPAAVTPFDQHNDEADLAITQKVRQAVIGADGLSMDARNVKIITADGLVTLRGPVDSDQERTRIVEMAKGVAGVKRVDDRLEVARD